MATDQTHGRSEKKPTTNGSETGLGDAVRPMSKKTCGPMYLDAVTKYGGATPDAYRAFAAGFISGQAEKVYLGACDAAMFRPSAQQADMVEIILGDVCHRYGLLWCRIKDEFWIYRGTGDASTLIAELAEMPVNSIDWHWRRAKLCGVPARETDPQFHLRKGYGERCD